MRFLFLAAVFVGCQTPKIVEIKPNDNLVTEGIPPVSAQVVEQTHKYTDFRPTYLLDVHPTKNELLVLTRQKDQQTGQLHIKHEGQAGVAQLTNYPDSISGAIYEPNKGNYFIFSKDVDGTEKHQIYRYDIDAAKITLLTDGKSRNLLGAWSNKGDKFAYTSSRRNGKDQDFYVIDPLRPETDQQVMKFSDGDSWSILDWSPDDTKLLALQLLSVSESHLWLIDLKTQKRSLITPKSKKIKVAYDGAEFSSDGKSIYTITDKDSEFRTLVRIDLVTQKIEYLTKHIPWDIDGFVVSPSGKKMVHMSNEAGLSVVRILDLISGTESELKGVPTGVVYRVLWHKDEKSLRFSFSSSTSPADVFAFDLANNQLTRITQTESAIDTNAFVTPELIRWKAADGKEITGFLYMPAHKKGEKVPVRVMIHGGPEAQFRPVFIDQANYYINELGVALLMPNIRGSTGYGKKFLNAANGIKRVDAYEDINALLDWIKQQKGLDGDRIMVSGGSYGGHVALAVATRYNDKIACSLSMVGMSNLVSFLENTDERRRDLRRPVYGDERIPKVRQFLESIAPINHAKNITKPILIIQGMTDPRVPYSEAEQMVRTLKSINTPVWFLVAKNEGHGFSKKENLDYQFYVSVEFLKRYLLKSP